MHLFWIFAAAATPAEPGDEVVVQAAGPDPGQTSGAVTVLGLGPSLPPGQDVGSVLAQASGTQVRRLGGLGSFTAVSVRGSSLRHVEIFLDGLPLNPDGASVVDLSELPAFSFARVELWRGNAPVDYGSAAMGGVVNLVTAERPPPPSLRLSVGSFDSLHAEGLWAGQKGPVDGLLSVDGLSTQGDWRWFDDRGTEFNLADDRMRLRSHNATRRLSTLGRLRIEKPSWTLSVLDSFSSGHQQLPGDAANPATDATFATDRNLLALRYDQRLGLFRLQPDLWWVFRQDQLDDRQGEVGVGAQWSRDQSQTLGGQLLAHGLLQPWLIATANLRVRADHYRPYDRLLDQPDGARSRVAGGAAAAADIRLWKGKIGIFPVVQAEWLDARLLGEVPYSDSPVAPEGQDQSLVFTPRLGLLLRPTSWLSLKGNLGRYLRPPDFSELFGDRGNIVGNTDLLPEQGTAWDLGFHTELCGPRAWLTVDGSWAENRAENLIVYVQNSQQTQQARNIGQAWTRAVELSLSAGWSPWIQSQSSLTWLQSRNLQADPTYANRELPGLPNLDFSQSLSLRWEEKLQFTYNFSWTGASWLDPANYQRTAPRPLHGLALQSRPAPGLPTFEVEVLNLLDVRGMAVPRDPLNPRSSAEVVKPLTDFAGFPLPGRTILVGLRWTGRSLE